MKTFPIAVSLFLSVAHAGDRNSAYNTICKPMTFEPERDECVAKIKVYSYFDDRGLGVCKSVVFDSNKISCLGLIGDRTYEDFEMDHCINQTFESEKLSCLKESGTPYKRERICVQRAEAIRQLEAGIKEMRAGNITAADQRFSNLLAKFTDCSH